MPHGDETIFVCALHSGRGRGMACCLGPFSFSAFFFSEGLFSACIAEGVWIGAETSSSSLFVPAANGHAC